MVGKAYEVIKVPIDDLSIEEAKKILDAVEIGQRITIELVAAAAVLMRSCETDDRAALDDLLRCLDLGGIIAEFGARGLYVRTGRDGLGWSCPSEDQAFCVDRLDWEQYLREPTPL
jgi:hypothetical protein